MKLFNEIESEVSRKVTKILIDDASPVEYDQDLFDLGLEILVKKFLSNWEPSVAIFIESEIWPNFINEINRKEIPLILINARMTKKTFLKWNNLKNFSKSIFNKFNLSLRFNLDSFSTKSKHSFSSENSISATIS